MLYIKDPTFISDHLDPREDWGWLRNVRYLVEITHSLGQLWKLNLTTRLTCDQLRYIFYSTVIICIVITWYTLVLFDVHTENITQEIHIDLVLLVKFDKMCYFIIVWII